MEGPQPHHLRDPILERDGLQAGNNTILLHGICSRGHKCPAWGICNLHVPAQECWKHTVPINHRKQAVSAIFGDHKVDDKTVNYFAQNELYLADSIDNLETQLDTCVRFLDLITAERGIASEGYACGL
jgi:hypothetical protein